MADMMRRRAGEARGWSDPLGQLTRLNQLLQSPMWGPDADFSAVETSQWVPAVDIREEDQRFVVEADVPGVDPSEIEVTLENNMLTIRGERKEEKEATVEEGSGARRIERAYGAFYRRFTLPDTANPDSVKARNDHGVLRIEIGKKETAQSRRIPVENG
jgi:HSP20 family protein